MKPAPYPADTRAKGWRFELDHEQIRQSDTWALAPADVRPWLLMLWMTAWEHTPCGSMPSDDALIAARIGMPGKAFAKARETLMRGWWLAEDGRLYHDTISARVLAMLAKKDKDRARKAGWRARHAEGQPNDSAAVTQESRVTDAGQARDSARSDNTKHQAPVSIEAKASHPDESGEVHRFPPGFEDFWKAYPRKAGKDAAAKAFAKRRVGASLLAEMLAAIDRQKRSEQWLRDGGQFIPHPATWLNEGRWQDEIAADSGVPSELAELFSRGHG